MEKVTANLPKIGGAEETLRPKREEYPRAHRGRARFAAIRAKNRKKVLDPPSLAAFWNTIRSFADPKPEASTVTAGGLKRVFQQRVNPPEILPPQFDEWQHRINEAIAKLLPPHTTDPTAEGFFSRKWSEKDIEELNDYLRKSHSRNSAEGEDATSYQELMEVPPDEMAHLYNDFRLVVMESQFLKGLTILSHWRFRDWGNKYLKIPPWQNGFRQGYRTNNNPFILRCLKEWARAHGKTIYISFVDFSNAFPSTDQPTLWLKLTRMGVGGPLFD
ncbi:hypothetical protein FB45DRAFT_772650, partial [Roridomyces roridus]